MTQQDRDQDRIRQAEEERKRNEDRLQESLDRLDTLSKPAGDRATDQSTQATGTGGGGATSAPIERGPAESVKHTPHGDEAPDAAGTPRTGSSGVGSGLQPGGTSPAGGRRGGFGSIGTGGGSTGPGGGSADATKSPGSK